MNGSFFCINGEVTRCHWRTSHRKISELHLGIGFKCSLNPFALTREPELPPNGYVKPHNVIKITHIERVRRESPIPSLVRSVGNSAFDCPTSFNGTETIDQIASAIVAAAHLKNFESFAQIFPVTSLESSENLE